MTNRKTDSRVSATDDPRSEDPEPKPVGDRSETAAAPDKGILSRLSGALKGTVTIAPGTDLTDPVDVEWDAMK